MCLLPLGRPRPPRKAPLLVKDVVKNELAGCGTYCHDNGRAALRIYGAALGNPIELRYDKELKAFKSPTQRSEVASTHITRNTEDHWVPTGTSTWRRLDNDAWADCELHLSRTSCPRTTDQSPANHEGSMMEVKTGMTASSLPTIQAHVPPPAATTRPPTHQLVEPTSSTPLGTDPSTSASAAGKQAHLHASPMPYTTQASRQNSWSAKAPLCRMGHVLATMKAWRRHA